MRHGQTDWNKAGCYQGQSDIPLNETGLRQGREIAELLAGQQLTITALYSSPLQRARQTAEIIAGRLGLTVRIEPELREICQGSWEGKPYSEVIGHYNQLAASGQDAAAWRAPGGETVIEVAGRVRQAVDAIAACHPGQRVLLVMHALVIATLWCQAYEIDLRQVYAHLPEHARPVVLQWPVIKQETER